MRLFLVVILTLVQACWAQANDSKSWAKDIVSYRLKMKPKNEFEKWNADQWTHAAITCTTFAQAEVPQEIKKLPILMGGSFSMPPNKEAFCKALVKGPSPLCVSLKSTSAPFEFPPPGLPSNYIYMKKLVPEGTQVVVGGNCNLVANEFSTKQYFAGSAKVVWRSQPQRTSIQTASGTKQVKMGTIWFDVEGMPGKEQLPSMSAIILD